MAYQNHHNQMDHQIQPMDHQIQPVDHQIQSMDHQLQPMDHPIQQPSYPNHTHPLHSMNSMYPVYQDSTMVSHDSHVTPHQSGHMTQRSNHGSYHHAPAMYPAPSLLPSPSMVPHDIPAPAPPASYSMELQATAQPLDLSTKPPRIDEVSEFRSISPRDMRDIYHNKHVNIAGTLSRQPQRVSPYGMSSRSPLARTESPYYREQTPSPQNFAPGYSTAYLSSMRSSSTPESFSSHPLTTSDGVLNGLSGGAYRSFEDVGEMRDDSNSRSQLPEDPVPSIAEQQPEDEVPKYMDLDSNYLVARNGGYGSNTEPCSNSNSVSSNTRVECTISSPQTFSHLKPQSIISGKDHCPKSRLVKEHLKNEMNKEKAAESLTRTKTIASPSLGSTIPPYPSIPYSNRADPTALPTPRANPTALPNPRANPTALSNPRANPTALPNPRANPTALPNPRANPTALPTLFKIRSRPQTAISHDDRSRVQLDPDSSSDSKQAAKPVVATQHQRRDDKATSRTMNGSARQNGSPKASRAPRGSKAPVKRKSPSPDPSSNSSSPSSGSPSSGSPNLENEDSSNLGSRPTQIPTGKSFINLNSFVNINRSKPHVDNGDDRIIKKIIDKRKPGDFKVNYFENDGIPKMSMNFAELLSYTVTTFYDNINQELQKSSCNDKEQRRPSVGLTQA